MKRFERITGWISAGFNGVALAALGLMLIVVSADIVGAKFLSKPVPGAMDILSLLGLVVIGFSTSETYLKGRHIKVTFISMLLPPRIRKAIRLVSTSLCVLLFAAAVWRLLVYAKDMQVYGESSMTVNIPLAPFGYALGTAFIPVVIILCIQLYRVLKGEEE
jgi:TRAP-type C4-dicarboxylate transport system permease small subunit